MSSVKSILDIRGDLNLFDKKASSVSLGKSRLTIQSDGVVKVGDQTLVNESYLSLFGNSTENLTVSDSSTHTLTSDAYYDTVTIDTGCTLDTGGYRLVVKNLLVNNGTITVPLNDIDNDTNGFGGGTAAPEGGAGGPYILYDTYSMSIGRTLDLMPINGGSNGGGGVIIICAKKVTGEGTFNASSSSVAGGGGVIIIVSAINEFSSEHYNVSGGSNGGIGNVILCSI